jgi:cell wall-associated NlpC family hydrolase
MYDRAWTKPILVVAALAALLVLPATANAARYGTRTLAPGAHGGDVKKLQRYLTAAGHRTSADGEFGPRTARALKATESELELSPNGVATRREQRFIRRAVRDPGTGGTAFVEPPPPTKVVPGETGEVTDEGFAVAPASAPKVVKQVIAAGNEIATTPYKWGGGHGKWADSGYDCSGSISYALHGGGLLDRALVSGDFTRWGEKGRGSWITIYANGGHMYMVVAGMRFDTSSRSRSSSRWTMESRSSDGYAVTHPSGL